MALLATGAMAAPRTPSQALEIARRFVVANAQFNGLRSPKLALAPTSSATMAKGGTVDSSPAYYVCNVQDQGFVVVSGDDRFKEVLGYSTNGTYSNVDVPRPLRYWLSFLSQEMKQAISEGYAPSAKSSDVTSDPSQSVEPLITTKWNQDRPYNNKLQGYFTGCVATGTAQVMNYWKYPEHGTGSHKGAYEPRFEADFGATTYDWKNMLDSYGTGFESAAEVDAVSTLMLHLGVATDMRWGKDASGTVDHYAAYALSTYFNYNPNLYVDSRDYMSYGQWKNLIISQLQSGHPLCYSGISEGEKVGHFFVCDGYNAAEGTFHFNWGWAGYCDGYYVLSSLEPGVGGIGAGAGSYNSAQSIFVNVQPTPVGEYIPHFDAFRVFMSQSTNKTAKISALQLLNNNAREIKGSLGMAIYKEDGKLLKYVPSNVSLPINNFHIGALYDADYNYYVNLSNIPNGQYTVCAAFWYDDADACYPIRARYGTPTYYNMTVSGDNLKFDELPNNGTLADEATIMLQSDAEGNVYQNVVAKFAVTVTNNSAIAFDDEIGVKISRSRGSNAIIAVPATIAPGETKTIIVSGSIPTSLNVNDGYTAQPCRGDNGTYTTFGQTMTVNVKPESAGIAGVTLDQQNTDSRSYNTAGQRVSKDSKGIIITAGKKTVNN